MRGCSDITYFYFKKGNYMNITINEEIFQDENIPYEVKGVWASICATGRKVDKIIIVPDYVKKSREFRFAMGYLEWIEVIKGVDDDNNINV